MKRNNAKRVLALVLASVMLMQQSWVGTLAAETETVTEAQTEKLTEAPATEAPAPETKAEETQAPATKAEETQTPATEAPAEGEETGETQTPATEAPGETATEAPTEAPTEAVTEAVTEASTEAITEKESETEEEVVLDTAIKQEVFQKTVEDDVQPMIKYTVKVTNKAKTAVAEGVSVKVILADALSYAEEEGETAELGVYGKFDDAVNADVFKDIELSENVMDVYAEGSVALWQNQKIAAGEKKEFVFFAAVEDGVTDTEALRNLWFVNDEAVANDKLQWQNAELLKVEEELPTEFTCEYGNMVVTATLSDGAILPEGAQFVVTEKTLSEEEVALVEDAMGEDSADAPEEKQGEDGQTEETVADYVAYDMHFEVNGAEVEPQGGTVSVVISYNDALVMTPADEKADDMEIVEGSAEYQVLHLADDSTVEDVTDSVSATDDGKVSEVGFTTDSFSTFVIRGGWMTIAGSIEIFIDKIRLGTHEYTNINIDDASGIYTGFFDGNHDYRRYVVYVGETMQLSAAVPSSGAWKFEGGSDGIGSVNGTSNAVSSGKLTASFTGERVGDCSILLKNGDNTEKTFYITVKEPIYVKTKIDNIRHKDTINENLPGITTGYGEENYIWNPIASEDGSHERLYIKNFGMIKDGDANGGKYVAYPGDTISLTGVSNGGSEFSIDSSYGGIQEVTHSKDGNRATITCKVKEDAETGKQTYIQFGNEKFYIYVKPSENDANHFDIEIKDGGTYTITETQIDATGKETKIETVYNVFVCGVNYCNVYNADGKIITDSEGNLVGHLTAGEYWESDLGPDSTQYELSSAYQTDGKGHLRDGVNKVPETRAIKRTDVDKVVFNLELLLKPISRKVDGTDASVAGIDDFEVTGFNATMDKQDIMDASNKCPTNTGLDFTLDIHSRAILIQPKVQKILKDDTLQNGQFWFDLYSEDPSGENVEPIGTVSNTNTGEVLFKQILLSDDEIGTGTEKIYYIKERIPENKEKDSHIIYDTRIIKMVVKINAGDSLSADISYYYLDEKDAETLIKETPQFVNYKTTPEKTETTPGEGKMVEIGQEITYEITWENYRDEAAEVFVTDVLDPGVDFVSADPEETSYENHTVKWDLGEKKAGDSGKVTLTVKVNKDAFKNYQYDEDSDIPTDKGGKDHQVVNRAGVQVGNDSKVLTKIIPNPVPEKEETDPGKDELVGIGQEITYKIHWKNGHEESADVTITDKLDPGVDFESADHEGNHDEATHTVTWVLKAQPGGAEGDVELKVRVNKDAKLTWDYTEGAGADEDGKILNQAGVKIGNDDEVKTEIIPNPVDEGPEKTELEPGDRKMVGIGDEIVYKITWKNYQDAEADVVITDKLDPGVEFVKASDSGTPSGDVVTWNLGKKAAKSEGFVTLTVKVTEKAFEGWEYVDETRLEDDNDKFEAVDGKDYEVWNRAAVKVGNDPKVYTNIVENPVPEKTEPTPGDRLMVNVGDPITYEIGWKNGYKKEAEVIVTDPLEPGVSYVSSEPTGTYDEKTHTVTWEFKAKSEEKGTIKLNVTVNENAFKDWKYGEADAPVVNADEKVKDYEVWNRAKVQIDDDSQYTAIVENPVPEKTEQTPGDRVMVNVGDPITYEIGWKNGHKEAAKVTVTDPLDPGVTYESSKPEGKYDEKTHTVTWEFEAKGEEKGTIELNVTVNENVFKDWKYGEADAPVVNADEKAKDYEVWNRAKVQIDDDSQYTAIVENPVPEKTEPKPGDRVMVNVGDPITYEIGWKNGHKEAAKVTVTDPLDPGVTYESSKPEGKYDEKTHTVTWEFEAKGEEKGTIELTVTVNENAFKDWKYGEADAPVVNADEKVKDYEVWNRAKVQVDNDSAYTDIVENPVPEKTEPTPGDRVMVNVGDPITYEIGWKNGHKEVAKVTVTDPLDPGVTYVSSKPEGKYDEKTHTVTWEFEAKGEEKGTIELNVTVNENVFKDWKYGEADAPVVNADEKAKDYEVWNRAKVQVGNDSAYTDIVENSVPEKTEVTPGKGIMTEVGKDITYEIHWKNGHKEPATVTVTDKLDPGVTFKSADNGGTCKDGVVTWTLNAAAGEEGSVKLIVTVNENAYDTWQYGGGDKPVAGEGKDYEVLNRASVKVGHDPAVMTDIIPNPVPEKTEVTPGKGIMTEVGKDIMYEIHWKNGHDEPATVTVTDKLDPGVTFKSADNGGTCTDGVVTWMLNAAAGEEGSVKLTVTVNENAYKTYTYGDGDTPTAGEGKDYEVLNRAGVQVGNDAKVLTNIIPNPVPEKEEIDPGANETVYVGDQITYEIYWKNGHDTAADVTVTDPLDEGLDFVSADQGGTYDSATRTVTWVIRNVAAGQSGKVTLTTKVNLDARKDDHIVENQAGVQVGHDPKVLTQIIPNPTPEEPRNGKISVTKELTVLGEKVFAVDETFYVALFSDEACKKRVTEIKALEFKRASSATVTFENIDIGRIYYVGEVNSDGEVILNGKVKDGTLFTANFNKGKSIVVENSDGSGTIVFENTFREIPPGFYREGVLNITKKLLGVDGEALESDETFYAGIFADEAHTTLSDKVTRNVVALELNGSSSASESVSVVCEPGKKTTLYVTEVTSDGTPVGKSFGYTVTVDNGEVTLDESNMSANVTITNQEQEETESEFESESESEAVKSTARSVKTGDNTPIARYVLLMLAAAVLATMVAVLRRRRRIEK